MLKRYTSCPVCVHACVHACVCACMRVCVHVSVNFMVSRTAVVSQSLSMCCPVPGYKVDGESIKFKG